MKNKVYLLMAMVLLVGLLPAAAIAAPPKPPFVTVRLWTLPVDPYGSFYARLSAWDIDWRVPKAATIELGYKHCDGICETVVEVTYTVMKDDKYPQNLDLAGKPYHDFGPGNCTLQQFIHVRDKSGAVLTSAWSVEQNVCLDPPEL